MSIQNIIDTVKQFGSVEATKELIDLQQKMLDAQQEIQSLRNENHALKEEIIANKNMVDIDDFLYNKANPAFRGPFCHGCWGIEGKLVRIIFQDTHQKSHNQVYICPACKGKHGSIAPSEERIDKILD